MELRKSLLQAIFIGISAGSITTSCTITETIEDVDKEIECFVKGDGECTDDHCWDCPACGLG